MRQGGSHDLYARILKVFIDDPMPARELAEEVGVSHYTAYRILRALKKHKVAHICAWDKDSIGRALIPVYKFGSGKDAKPVKKTAAERQRDCRERKKAKELNALLVGGKL